MISVYLLLDFVCFGGRCSLGETYEKALIVVYKAIKPNDLFCKVRSA